MTEEQIWAEIRKIEAGQTEALARVDTSEILDWIPGNPYRGNAVHKLEGQTKPYCKKLKEKNFWKKNSDIHESSIKGGKSKYQNIF